MKSNQSKIIIFSGTPESNHSVSMIRSALDKNDKNYELWANDLDHHNKLISQIWHNSFVGVFKLYLKLKKFKYINLQHEFNVWGPQGILTIPFILFFLKKKNITLTLHTVIDYNNVNRIFLKRFSLNANFVTLFKIYFYLFFKIISLISDKIIVHTKEQKKILIEVYNCRSKVKINYIGIRNISKKKKIKIKYDIIIFGYLAPRKGIKELIIYLEKNKRKLKILIAGGLQNKYLDYYKEIKNLMKISKHTYKLKININDKEINKLHMQSKVALYGHTEMLGTSGPLFNAILCDNNIVAPKKSIFKELLLKDRNTNLFSNYNEINNLIENLLLKKRRTRKNLKKKLSWYNYLKKSFY